MVDDRRIHEEVEKTLRSYDGEGELEENPFLFTRVAAAREVRLRRAGGRIVLKPALKFAALALLLLLNLLTALYSGRSSHSDLQELLVSELREDLRIEQTQDNF